MHKRKDGNKIPEPALVAWALILRVFRCLGGVLGAGGRVQSVLVKMAMPHSFAALRIVHP